MRPTNRVRTSQSATPYLYRDVRPNWHGLFEKLAETIGKFSPTKWHELAPYVYKTLAELFKLKPVSIEEEVFTLVQKALVRAVAKVVEQCLYLNPEEQHSLSPENMRRLGQLLVDEPIEITESFFAKPTRCGIVGRVARHLAGWLRNIGVENATVEAAVIHFQQYFVKGLADELDEQPENYKQIVQKHAPQFRKMTETDWSWFQYYTKLQAKASPEVLDLGVTLDEVYVELRAYTEPSTKGTGGVPTDSDAGGQKPRTIGLLQDFAEAWVEEPRDAIFALSGGPGSGKSAFARRFAAWRAWTGPERWTVFYVPLHRFDATGEMRSVLKQFAGREIQLISTATIDLFSRDSTERVLIVFDGLDELSKQGAVGEEVAAKFYHALDGFVKEIDGDNVPVRLKVMVCGRPVAVSQTDADERKAERVRHVLPYRIDNDFDARTVWRGQPELAKLDQRDEWWAKYGSATGDDEINKMPDTIRTEKLDPLTCEPILNGLIA